MGGVERGATRSGDTVSSQFGYNLARQGEFALGMGAQFAAFGALYQGVNQVKEYQKGVADLKIAMGDGQAANQTYLNSLADLSRAVGENAHEAFDSAASGVRAFGAALAEAQGKPLTDLQKQAVGYQVTQNATQLGIIGGEGQNKATDQIIAIGTAYGLQAGELNQVTDAIAATKRFVGGEPAQIAEGLQRFAKSASDGGLDINGAATLVGLVQSRTGEGGDAIASSLGRILQIVSGTHGDKIASQYANDGRVSTADRGILANGNSTAWERLQAFSDIFRAGDTATRDNILGAIGGTRNRAEASSLLGEMPLINQFNKQFDSAGPGSAQGQGLQQYNQQMNTLEGTIKRVEGDLKNIAADLGNSGLFNIFGAMAKGLDPLLTGLDDVLRLIGQLNGATHGVSGAIAGVAELYGASRLYGAYKGRSASEDPALAENTTAISELTAAVRGQTVATEAQVAATEVNDAELAVADAEGAAGGGMLSRFGGAQGLGLLGGMGLMALGGSLQNGHPGSTQNNIGTMASYAGTGAMIGSFIGPEGTLIGGGLGLLAGGIKSAFDSNQQNDKNQAYLDQTRASAQQAASVGNFAQAVRDFQEAAATFKINGDSNRQQQASNEASFLSAFKGGSDSALLDRLGSPVRPASNNVRDRATAGLKDLAHEEQLRHLASTMPEWSKADLVKALASQLGYDTVANNVAGTEHLKRVYGASGDPLAARNAAEANVAAAHGFGGGAFVRTPLNGGSPATSPLQGSNPLVEGQTGNAAALLKAAVDRAVKESGAAENKQLTDQQVTSIVKNALPGLSQDQINGLVPQIQSTLQSMAKGSGAAGALNALANLETAAAPDIVAAYDQIRKGLVKKAQSRAEMEQINQKYGGLEVSAAGNNSALIASVFHNLDQATINHIVAAGNDAATAANAAAQMTADVEHALATVAAAEAADLRMAASQGLGQTALLGIGNAATGSPAALAAQKIIDQYKALGATAAQASAHASAINAAANAAGAAANLPKVGGGRAGGAGHQYDYVKSAIAEARAARAGGGDVSAAMAAIVSAQDQLQHNQKDSAAWWRAYASLWQAKQQLAKAEVTEASTLYMLTHDFTNPVVQAYDKLVEAEKTLSLDKKLHFSREVIRKDELALDQAKAADQKAAFDQELQDIQTKEQLGQMSHAAYVRWLQNESKRLHDIKHMSRQQYDEMNQVDQALLQANDSMNAQWNLTSIDARGLIYQVKALSQIGQMVGAGNIPGAGIVNNTNSNNTTYTIVVTSPGGFKNTMDTLMAKKPAGATITTRTRRS